MRQLKFFKKDNTWVMIYSSDDTMNLIGFFITDEISMRGICKSIQWLQNGKEDSIGCNYVFMDKEDGNVILSCLFDEDDHNDRTLTVPTAVMIDLLEQWDMVCKMEPEEVIITYEQGKFQVEGRIIVEQKEIVH